MTISKLISELTDRFGMSEEVEKEELEMFIDTLYGKSKYCFRVGDIVKITKKYPEYTCVYIGVVGSFDYGTTEEGFGPTEAIRLKIAMYVSTTGTVEMVTSTAPSGDTEYATEEEIVEFTKAAKEYGYIL